MRLNLFFIFQIYICLKKDARRKNLLRSYCALTDFYILTHFYILTVSKWCPPLCFRRGAADAIKTRTPWTSITVTFGDSRSAMSPRRASLRSHACIRLLVFNRNPLTEHIQLSGQSHVRMEQRLLSQTNQDWGLDHSLHRRLQDITATFLALLLQDAPTIVTCHRRSAPSGKV